MANGNGKLMPPLAEAHLQAVKDEFCDFVDGKYRAGQKENNDLLPERTEMQLIHEILSEATDLVVYVLTLRAKILERQH